MGLDVGGLARVAVVQVGIVQVVVVLAAVVLAGVVLAVDLAVDPAAVQPVAVGRRGAEVVVAEGPLIVAIDGPSGVGKSTVARQLAERLGLEVLDTGAMYRAMGLEVVESTVDPNDRQGVLDLLEGTSVDVRPGPEGLQVLLDGEPVGDRIRTPEVSETTSLISTYPEVRRRMVHLQRQVAERQGAVVEGRDIGTVVFPNTPHKFFLRADVAIRAERRRLELAARGREKSLEEVQRELARRDERDRSREDSPLLDDGTYHRVDTSDKAPETVVDEMLAAILQGGTEGP